MRESSLGLRLAKLAAKRLAESEELSALAAEAERAAPPATAWAPQAGPQALAYASEADVIGYGGAAGGGKSDLALGKAATQHRRTIIFRREFPRLDGLIERSQEFYAGHYNRAAHKWRLADGRRVRFAHMQQEAHWKKYQGQPNDLQVFDEATEFTEMQIRSVMAWNRSATGQRCQVLMTFNPPTDDGGSWVVRFFAPWLDERHPRPARDGELRWYAVLDGEEREVDSGAVIMTDEGPIQPKSRTFFHASLRDNPILAATGYGSTIDALPEPLRSLLKGNFHAARGVDPWQVIPSAWVEAAQARWRPDGRRGPCTGVGLDVARGGRDQTVAARLHGSWAAPLQVVPGAATPDGGSAAALVLADALAGLPVGVDVIGLGASAYDHLRGQKKTGDGLRTVIGVNASAKAEDAKGQPLTDRSKQLRFYNLRAAMWWLIREALDPEGTDPLALPPDDALAADLKAPKWSLTSRGVLVEDKKDVRQRLGRSPDLADALAMAYLVPLLVPPPPPPAYQSSTEAVWS